MMERLQKVLAHAGVASRRQSEKIIAAGRVQVNGEIVTELGTKVTDDDEILVDGKHFEREQKVYIILNKPVGTISTVHDPKGRPTVLDCLDEKVSERVYPVGRLDFDTSGALLLTNDGRLTNHLTHPRYEFPKIYRALIKGQLTKSEQNQLEKGVIIGGEKTAQAKVSVISESKKESIVDLQIHEGRYHQVKKMFAAVGSSVIQLHRTHFGPLTVENLPSGSWRYLTEEEILKLKKF